jgi:hypothetical protein
VLYFNLEIGAGFEFLHKRLFVLLSHSLKKNNGIMVNAATLAGGLYE